MSVEEQLREGYMIVGYHEGCGGELRQSPYYSAALCSRCSQIVTTTRPGAAEALPPADGSAGSVLSDWRKRCSCCGREHDWTSWHKLTLEGTVVYEFEDDEEPPRQVLEGRTCWCGSSLTVDLLAIVELVRPGGGDAR